MVLVVRNRTVVVISRKSTVVVVGADARRSRVQTFKFVTQDSAVLLAAHRFVIFNQPDVFLDEIFRLLNCEN